MFKKFKVKTSDEKEVVFEINEKKSEIKSTVVQDIKKEHDFSFFLLLCLVFFLPIFFIPLPEFSFLFSKGIVVSLITTFLFILWVIARLKDGEFTASQNPIIILGISIPVVYLFSSLFCGLISISSLFVIEFVNLSKVLKIFIFIAFFVSLFFVALTNLTILWVVLGIFSFITSAFIISNNKFQKDQKGFMGKKFPVISILVLVMSFTFVLGANNVGAKLPSLFKITDTEVRPSLIGTMSVAKGTLTSKYALLGAGPNKFLSQWLLHKPLEINNTAFANVDFVIGFSFISSALITVGILGFILWIAFLGALFYLGFKSAFASSENYLLTLSFFATLFLWIFSIVYVPSNVLMTLTFVFTGALIALLIQNGVLKTKKITFLNNQRFDFIVTIVLIFLILASLVGAYTISQKFMASVYSNRGLGGSSLEEAEKNIVKAIQLSENADYYKFLSKINELKLNTPEEGLTDEETKQQFQAILNNIIQSAEKATEIDKNNYSNWVFLGDVYEAMALSGVEGAYDGAISSYKKAVGLNPRNPSLIFKLGALEYNNKNLDEAVATLEKAVILQSNYSDARYYLGLAYYNLGRTEDARIQFETVSLLNPDNKDIKDLIKSLGQESNPTPAPTTTEEEGVEN